MTGAPRPLRWLSTTLILEVAANWLANLPTWLDFPAFAFGDLGASLTIQDLAARGYRPGVDFSHHYGLLPIALGRAWFGLVGRTPLACYAAMGLLAASMARSLALAAQSLRVGRAGSILLAVGLPFWIQSCYPNLAHAMEAALICRALAEQARGRRGAALALASLAVLAKPSLGFAYGLVLVAILLLSVSRRGDWSWRSALGREAFGPSVAVFGAMLPLLGWLYGAESVARTVLPLAGAATYRAGGFGFFFGSGREFWLPKGAGPGYYLGTVAGLWIVGSIALAVAGLVAAGRRPRGPADELVATAGAVHALFVFELFGHANTWVYDSYLLGLGLAALPAMGRGWKEATWALVALAAIGLRTPLGSPWIAWRTHVRSAESAGLWCDPRELAGWSEARALLDGRPAVVLATSGCVELICRGFEPAEGVFLVAGLEDQPDVARKAARVAGATWVIVPKYLGNVQLTRWPAFARALGRFEVVLDGPDYRVYRALGAGAGHRVSP